MGLVVQLGHVTGTRCLAPLAGPRAFAVIHVNGVHPVTIQFCQCSQVYLSGSRVEQLLRSRLFPATLTNLMTVATQTGKKIELQHYRSTVLDTGTA